jgi:hypothetical protein
MTHEEIINGNKLIAEFVGSRFYDFPITDEKIFYYIPQTSTGNKYLPLNGIHELNKMLFHSSWDWLMPVVGKILTDANYIDEYYSDIHDSLWSLGIDNTFNSCVKFIKWYNNQK